jgi:heme exporter protein C
LPKPVVERQRHLSLRAHAALVVFLVGATIALIFFYAPVDQDGMNQKIFYFHVPIAFTAYGCFAWGGWKALRHLWRRQPGADLESYTAIHQGVIFGALTLATGSIWARFRWGEWWTWQENQLVLFLVLFLFYAAYFMVRYSVEPGLQRENFSAVYAIFGVVLIPVSALAIRIAGTYIHPVVIDRGGPEMAASQTATFCVAIVAMLALASLFYRLELAGKRLDASLRELRELLA